MKSDYSFSRFLQILTVWAGLFFLLCACKADVPDEIIGEEEMEDILYDYHIAQSLAKNQPDSIGYKMRDYIQAVWYKYGITEVEFDKSLEWYTRHSDRLYKIYQRIDERYAFVTSSSGERMKSNYAGMKTGKDTVNVWNGNETYLLLSSGENRMTFEWIPDTSFHKGDCLLLHFNTKWFYREGAKIAVAQLAVWYDNDSVAVINRYIYNSGAQDIYMNADIKYSVKQVTGFIYQETDWNERPKLLFISDFALIRFRKSKYQEMDSLIDNNLDGEIIGSDASESELRLQSHSASERKLRDSLIADDSLEKMRPHFKEIENPQPMMRHRRMKAISRDRQ